MVMSFWDVSDVGTDGLMHRLIDRMKEPNEGIEYSLAGAIRDLKQSQPDPAVWSAFTVYGNPTAP